MNGSLFRIIGRTAHLLFRGQIAHLTFAAQMSSVSSKINYAFKLRRRQSALLAQDTIDKQPVHGIINLWHYQRQKCRVRFQGGCLLPFPGREIFFFPPVKGGDAYGYISRAVSVLPSGNRHYWPDVHGHKKEVRPPSSLH